MIITSEKTTELVSKLRVLTFFVTYRCNSRCRTCFYWQDLNNAEKRELGLVEIEKISVALPNFTHLLLSGGEPLLRPDLFEIISPFILHNQIVTVDLPTNGLLPEKAAEFVQRMLVNFPHIVLTVGVSLDGLRETHDSIRGVAGNFGMVFETLNAINGVRYQLAAENSGIEPRLQLYTLTVVTDENVKELPILIEYVTEEADVDGMMFELMRGSPPDKSLRLPKVSEFDNLIDLSLRVNSDLFSKRTAPDKRAIKLSYLKEVYHLQRRVLRGEKLPFTCQAGKRLAVLEPNGCVRLCELLPPVGNLREFAYNFTALQRSAAYAEQSRWIKDNRCSCTHCVNLGHSIDYSHLSYLRRKWSEWNLAFRHL